MPAGTLGPPRTGSFLIGGVVVLPVWPSAATQHGQGSGNMGVFEGPEPSAGFLRIDAARISPIGPNTDLGFQASLFIDDSHTEDYAVLFSAFAHLALCTAGNLPPLSFRESLFFTNLGTTFDSYVFPVVHHRGMGRKDQVRSPLRFAWPSQLSSIPSLRIGRPIFMARHEKSAIARRMDREKTERHTNHWEKSKVMGQRRKTK